ncbi:MAG: hypothetical protein KF896_15850 [Ignavibacteriae bacterium]|nr:hypothetical protein [Ignavibacteriota bacterium]MBX3045186.1 hypothetical protein [Ignavibacteriota bacterium]
MRYQITFKMKSPIIVYEPIMFDSLLLYAYIKDKLGYVPQLLEIDDGSDVELPETLLNKHESGVYLSSIMQSDDEPLLDLSNFTKHFHKRNIDLVENKKLKILTSKGQYKSYNLPYETKNYESVYFVIDTENINEVIELLSKHIYSLGKKRNRGYGLIDNISYEMTDKAILRPAPDDNGDLYLPIKPPYWRINALITQKLVEI